MPAADGSIVAIALDGEARIADCSGAGWRPVESLWSGPGVSAVDPTRQLVTHIRFPRPGSNTGTAWRRVGRRQALVLPILNCAVTVQIDGGDVGKLKIVRAAIALGPVAPRPFRAREAETFLRGRALTADALAEAGRLAQTAANPRTRVIRASREYRLAIVPTLVGEALAQAARQALG
jgi:carbon-monoxide dehydrogenase medium subunit